MSREIRSHRRWASSRCVGGSAVEAGDEVGVSEADHGVLAGQGGSEEGQVGRAEGAEGGVAVARVGFGAGTRRRERRRLCF